MGRKGGGGEPLSSFFSSTHDRGRVEREKRGVEVDGDLSLLHRTRRMEKDTRLVNIFPPEAGDRRKRG